MDDGTPSAITQLLILQGFSAHYSEQQTKAGNGSAQL